MAGQAPATPPPGFGAQYADRQAQQQRLETALVGTDLDRRASMMGNIISNAPNIAALSGVGAVDQLANMFADAEAPIFNNAYGQQGDMLRRLQQKASLAATNRSNMPRTVDNSGPTMKSTDVLIRYEDGRTAIMDSNSAKEALESAYANATEGTAPRLPFEIIQWGAPISGDINGPAFTQQNVMPTNPQQPQTTEQDNIIRFKDGSYVKDGVAYDKDGNPV